jgi:hypothetical protein
MLFKSWHETTWENAFRIAKTITKTHAEMQQSGKNALKYVLKMSPKNFLKMCKNFSQRGNQGTSCKPLTPLAATKWLDKCSALSPSPHSSTEPIHTRKLPKNILQFEENFDLGLILQLDQQDQI